MAEKQPAKGGVFIEARPKDLAPDVVTIEDIRKVQVGRDYRRARDMTRRSAILREQNKKDENKGYVLGFAHPDDAERLKAEGWLSVGGVVNEGDGLMKLPLDKFKEKMAIPVAISRQRAGMDEDALRAQFEKRGINPDTLTIIYTKDGRTIAMSKLKRGRDVMDPGGQIA